MHGFPAYDNGKPIGWCNAAPRGSYPRIHWPMEPGPDKGEKVWAIVCFVIASTHRGKRVASRLLNTACNKFSEKGFDFAEAYPVKNPQSDAYNFPDPLSMYLKNGFTRYRDNDWYLVVRKRLSKRSSELFLGRTFLPLFRGRSYSRSLTCSFAPS
jgi:GNAT superfamily N-acetyltransferase